MQFVIASSQGNPLILPNNPSGIINLANQPQQNEAAASSIMPSMPVVSVSSATDFLAADNSLSMPASQLGQLLQQNATSAMQVAFLSQS